MRRFIGCCVLAAAAAAVCLAEGEAEAGIELTNSFELTDSFELTGTGHVLDHPAGWTATRETMYDGGRLVNVLTVITELPEDQDLGRPPSGYRLVIDHLQVSRFAHAIRPDQQYQSLLEFYLWYYDWPEPEANPKLIEAGADELMRITGQKPVTTRARKSVAAFKLRQGMAIGTMVTLRGERMYEFLDRLISIALPRVRDFRGISPNGFDGRGNYTLGLRDQLIFLEIDYMKVDQSRGMNICVVTTAMTDDEGRMLLKLLGMPFRASQ